MSGILWMVLLGGCWTGHEPTIADPIADPSVRQPRVPREPIRVVLERTGCMGPCPSYTVTIGSDGGVQWLGEANVAAIGVRTGVVTRSQIERLARSIDRAHFFELDDSGHTPVKPACVRTGSTVSCSMRSFTMCSDTTHAIVTITRGQRTHQVDDPHCSDQDRALVELENLIDEVARTESWIGRA